MEQWMEMSMLVVVCLLFCACKAGFGPFGGQAEEHLQVQACLSKTEGGFGGVLVCGAVNTAENARLCVCKPDHVAFDVGFSHVR